MTVQTLRTVAGIINSVDLHFTLQPGATFVQPVPKQYNALAYVLDGAGLFGTEQEYGDDGQMVIFSRNYASD